MFNFNNAMNLIKQMQNPQQMLSKMGIPQECMSNPQSVAQYLLNNGKVNQQQIQQAQEMYRQIFDSNAQG